MGALFRSFRSYVTQTNRANESEPGERNSWLAGYFAGILTQPTRKQWLAEITWLTD
jgi:hypothetical protein